MFPSNLLSVEVASGNINKKDGNLTGFEEALYKTVHGDFEDLRNFQELCARRYMATGNSVNLMEFFVKQS